MSAVIVSLRVKATPDVSFDVFTQEIAAWWKPNGLFQITPRGDGALRFEPGEGGRLITDLPNGTSFEIGRITAWAPGERLAFTWRQGTFAADQTTYVEVHFEAVGDETRVTVETPWLGYDPAGAPGPSRLPAGRLSNASGRALARASGCV